MAPPNPYVNLGFNPALGSVETVSHMVDMLTKAKTALEDAKGGIDVVKRSDSTVWKGDAAEKFRKEMSDKLPKRLDTAVESIGKAIAALSGWQGDLGGFQSDAKRLDGDAKAAKEKLDGAQQAYGTAQQNPDLQLAGQKADTDAQLANMQTRYNTAQGALVEADKAVKAAGDAYDAVIRQAHELEQRHDDDAKKVAGQLDSADDIAPHKPGLFSRALGWVKDHLGDIGNALALAAAVLGTIALIIGTGGAAFVPLMLASTALSAGALGFHAADPETWQGLKKGPMSGDFWSAAMTLGGDALGAIPGVGIAARGVNGAVRMAAHAPGAVGPLRTAIEAGRNLPGVMRTVAPRILTADASTLATKAGEYTVDAVNSYRTARGALPFIGSDAANMITNVARFTDVSASGLGAYQAALDMMGDTGIYGSKNDKTAVDGGLNGFNSPGAVNTIRDTLSIIRR
ncbi:hypothetical protein [Yinghuangia seranimata]|uniref:hypothetical protein n=1 Tax=Yinghuangia seranimata TaxID=408067 RepID=UPI00248B4554|nr:hypothetical protein [Yinghuangia seranimata]MDI2132475.1 hypothetical protein [Yinghuangia seranimata]